MGCFSDDCEDIFTCEDGTIYATCTGDPTAGRMEGHCGIFVSSSRGGDANPGTMDRPVRTLGRAVLLAVAGPKRVYACAEPFTEAVELAGGIELWGGLDCANGWAYVGSIKKTTLLPEPDLIPLRFLAGQEKSIAADVRVEAANARLPGGSSIAVVVSPDATMEMLVAHSSSRMFQPGAPPCSVSCKRARYSARTR